MQEVALAVVRDSQIAANFGSRRHFLLERAQPCNRIVQSSLADQSASIGELAVRRVFLVSNHERASQQQQEHVTHRFSSNSQLNGRGLTSTSLAPPYLAPRFLPSRLRNS